MSVVDKAQIGLTTIDCDLPIQRDSFVIEHLHKVGDDRLFKLFSHKLYTPVVPLYIQASKLPACVQRMRVSVGMETTQWTFP